MRLLIFTQKVDKNDSVLGFFYTWLLEFSKRVEFVTVICLEQVTFEVPENVRIYSLGKEKHLSQLEYITNLYKYLFLISGTYNRVFVHMNQEYVLLAGLYFKWKRIPVYMWRNHPYGNLAAYIAVLLSYKVFCTSPESFTARFKKTEIMPVGIDLEFFKPVEGIMRKKYSVCVVGRIAPVKHIELALQAIHTIISSGGQISLTVIGSPTSEHIPYYESLKKYVRDKNLALYISFLEAVPPEKLPEIYSGHEICLNVTSEGSFDKTIVEAAACGAMPIVASKSLGHFLPLVCITDPDPSVIAASLQKMLVAVTQLEIAKDLENFVKLQSSEHLFSRLVEELK